MAAKKKQPPVDAQETMTETAAEITNDQSDIQPQTASVEISENSLDGVEASMETSAEDSPEPARKVRKTKMEKAGEITGDRESVLRDSIQRNADREIKKDIRDNFFSGWAKMQAAKAAKIPLKGPVMAITNNRIWDENLEMNIPLVCAVVYLDTMFKVTIPFDQLYSDNAVDMSTVNITTQEGLNELGKRQRQMAAKLVGVEIEFIITHMDDIRECTVEDHYIVASRKEALAKRRLESFFPSRKGRAPLIQEGADVTAQIIGVAIHSVRLCVGGVDVSIPIPRFTCKWVADASQEYTPGQHIKVRIRNLTIDGDNVTVDASLRPLELESALRRQNAIESGMMLHGTITALGRANPSLATQEGSGGLISAYAYLPALDMPARITSFNPMQMGVALRTGDVCLFQVTGMSDSGFVKVQFMRKLAFNI